MRVVTKKRLQEFWVQHPEAREVMQAWNQSVKNCEAQNHSELKQTFKAADYVASKYTVFDVGGNKYRIVTVIHYNTQIIYIRGVFTHIEYDKWTKEHRGK
jgi:mRNA interferase HigB